MKLKSYELCGELSIWKILGDSLDKFNKTCQSKYGKTKQQIKSNRVQQKTVSEKMVYFILALPFLVWV